MFSNSLKTMKTDRDMSELRKLCVGNILCVVLGELLGTAQNVSVFGSCGPQTANCIFPITLPTAHLP